MATAKSILQELREKFKCDSCMDYLRPPLYLCSDDKTICTPCKSQVNDTNIRPNKAVENIGSLFKFPCCYKKFGCKIEILWVEAETHENDCPFRQFHCPACDTSNKWIGKAADMLAHVNTNHKHLLFSTECRFSLELKNSLYFIETMGELYVLLYDCDTDSGLLWFSLKSVGSLEQAERRHFKLILKRNENPEYYERKQVESAANWEINEKSAIKIDLCVLRMKLQLKSENVVTLQVNVFSRIPLYNGSIDEGLLRDTECPVCQDYMSAPIYQCSTGHSFCSYCKPKLQTCPTCRAEMSESRNFVLESVCSKMFYKCMYADDGCDYASLPKDITDHEMICDYGLFGCPFKAFLADCSWRGRLDQMSSHTLEEHGLKF